MCVDATGHNAEAQLAEFAIGFILHTPKCNPSQHTPQASPFCCFCYLQAQLGHRCTQATVTGLDNAQALAMAAPQSNQESGKSDGVEIFLCACRGPSQDYIMAYVDATMPIH